MGTKIFTVAVLLVISLATIFSTCSKGGLLGCPNSEYNFQISESAYPDKDSIKVGDTLFLKMNNSTTLADVQTGKIIAFNNAANLGNVITVLKFVNNLTPGAINDFELTILNGFRTTAADPMSQIAVRFSETNNTYSLLLSFIPKDTGRYVLAISDAAGIYRSNAPCPKADFGINFTQTNQHFYLLNKWRPDLILDSNGMRHVYYFKVY